MDRVIRTGSKLLGSGLNFIWITFVTPLGQSPVIAVLFFKQHKKSSFLSRSLRFTLMLRSVSHVLSPELLAKQGRFSLFSTKGAVLVIVSRSLVF